MIDRYTKIVLTVIAAALVALVLQNSFPGARAQMGSGCGSGHKPCYVETVPREPLYVTAGIDEPVYVAASAKEPLRVIADPLNPLYVTASDQLPVSVQVVNRR
jgi:hypothetical protein